VGVERGLEILLDLVRNVRLPAGPEDELLALVALRGIHRRDRLPARGVAMREELSRYVELAEERKVLGLLRWIEGRGTHRSWTGLLYRRRRNRHVLLFILLAKSIAPEERFGILRTLNKLGYWGNKDRLDGLLVSLRSRIPAPKILELGKRYLEVAGEVLFEDGGLVRPSVEVSVRRFLTWSWPHQLLHLIAWRSGVDGSSERKSANPVFHGDTIEFSLARAGVFARIERKGGRLSRHILRELDYRDYRSRPARGLTVHWLSLVVLLLAVAWAVMWGSHKLDEWDRTTLELAREARLRYGGACTASLTPECEREPAAPIPDSEAMEN
jgi:hypothetical protein